MSQLINPPSSHNSKPTSNDSSNNSSVDDNLRRKQIIDIRYKTEYSKDYPSTFCLCDIMDIDLRGINRHNTMKCDECRHEILYNNEEFVKRISTVLQFIETLKVGIDDNKINQLNKPSHKLNEILN